MASAEQSTKNKTNISNRTQRSRRRTNSTTHPDIESPIIIPGTDLQVVFEIPPLQVEDKPWYHPELLDEEELIAKLREGDPKETENPTVIFLLGPKACGKTTFMKVHKEYLHGELSLNEDHCHVDYEFLRNSHKGYSAIVEHGKMNNTVYALASKTLKRQFKGWKLETAFDYTDRKLDIVVSDNRGKKLAGIVDRLNGYSIHVVFMFISFQTCLERQRKRAYEEGRSIKPLKYCKLMKKLSSAFERAEGHIIIVDNEDWRCEIKGTYDQTQTEEAMSCVHALHEKYNNFPFALFQEPGFKTIFDKHIPARFQPFCSQF